ncbi:MAG: hypothetical protein NTV33_10900 [Coprothermobacterota bacterium]|nr:hypothetical protein [Coprothermobacterota bacterium]
MNEKFVPTKEQIQEYREEELYAMSAERSLESATDRYMMGCDEAIEEVARLASALYKACDNLYEKDVDAASEGMDNNDFAQVFLAVTTPERRIVKRAMELVLSQRNCLVFDVRLPESFLFGKFDDFPG